MTPSASDLVLGTAVGAFLVWVLLWQYSAFVAGTFGYHDLTIISDFFSNAWNHGRPFWVTNASETHLKTHFTPSLLCLLPFYPFFKTQFALIALMAISVCGAIFVATRQQLAALTRLGTPPLYRYVLTAAFFVMFSMNRYTLRCLASAHFEALFMFACALLFAALSGRRSWRTLAPLALFALGVRQDAGLFLFFVCLGCCVAPRAWGSPSRYNLLFLAGACCVYVVLASKVILPWFGNDGGTRFWHQWGATWPEVFTAWARDPERVKAAVQASEFDAFNSELSYVQVLNPLAWAATQLPGILFYTADSPDKPHLYFYNSAFLLPGLMLCVAFSQLHAVTWLQRLLQRKPKLRHVGLTLVSAVFVYAAVNAAFVLKRDDDKVLSVGELKRHDVFVSAPLRKLLRCPNVHSVATDFVRIVYVPLRLDKYLLMNAAKADLVVVQRHADQHMPFFLKPKALLKSLEKDGAYTRAGAFENYEFYLRSSVSCPESAPRPSS